MSNLNIFMWFIININIDILVKGGNTLSKLYQKFSRHGLDETCGVTQGNTMSNWRMKIVTQHSFVNPKLHEREVTVLAGRSRWDPVVAFFMFHAGLPWSMQNLRRAGCAAHSGHRRRTFILPVLDSSTWCCTSRKATKTPHNCVHSLLPQFEAELGLGLEFCHRLQLWICFNTEVVGFSRLQDPCHKLGRCWFVPSGRTEGFAEICYCCSSVLHRWGLWRGGMRGPMLCCTCPHTYTLPLELRSQSECPCSELHGPALSAVVVYGIL